MGVIDRTDPAYVDHLARRGQYLADFCTCQTRPDGSKFYSCKNEACQDEGQACGGYCRSCFTECMSEARNAALTFDEVAATNRARCERWHADGEPWSGADWSGAMAGEAGEMAEAVEALVLSNATVAASGRAANVTKKLRRIETGAPGQPGEDRDRLLAELAGECADVFLYLGLLADHYGIDLPAAIVAKFNAVSERQGFPERLRTNLPGTRETN